MRSGVELSDKEALGVYLLLAARSEELDGTMARLARRIEDLILKTLTVEQYQDLDALYRSLPDRTDVA